MKNLILLISLYSLLTSHISLAQNKTDEKGLKQGYWEKIDPSTKKIIYKGNFKDGKPQGGFTYYFKGMDSVQTKMDFRQDGKIAYAKLFYYTGKREAQGKYIGEQKDSLWTFYDGAGTLISTENYTMGKRNGVAKVFFPDGKVSEEKIYKDGRLEGPFKQYYPDKSALKAEGTYAKDNYNGKCVWYFPNGTAAAQGVYENGLKKGVWIYKESDGKLKEREVWVNGKQLKPKEMEEYFKKNKPAPETTPEKKPNGGKPQKK